MPTIHLPSCLEEHPREGQIVGELVVKYGELEWMLCRVVALINGDFDATVKSMYRTRGEHARLQIADALVTSRLSASKHEAVFRETIEGVDLCRAIRNSYAHAHWLSGQKGAIGFYDLEGLARGKGALDLRTMRRTIISYDVLIDQRRYFSEVLHNLVQMFYDLEATSEGRRAATTFISPLLPPARHTNGT